ncbi:biotin/lipoyl-binding protein [Pseudoflavitalea sp. G-6-1-2]|uniref:HlyD family secretion protein n=1 Tax=Pseudoflavitalea sp. G-6-1-2 TaxID=2728841 RepID=UPI00146A1253|nr:biotin/lipoyl-binding protein [Pseudoflavitalea sp. G-6-1-2]NML22074.1 biotin/lipoyl-binding protein [Pseudoflavitalea sp. G-6-1-2]
MKLRSIVTILTAPVILIASCKEEKVPKMLGKVKRETISFVPKVTGRILKLYVQEGATVKPGDTLAMLDVPEVSAKIAQAKGVVEAATAQRQMAHNGATPNQMKQIQAKYRATKEQFNFAQKSFDRAKAMFNDSMMAPQAYDEAFAKYQGAKAQLDAVTAELNEAEKGPRIETREAAAGQQAQAKGVLQEAEVAYSERYILATNYATLETIALKEGELATAGYPIFNGYLPASTWFRFTVPESKIQSYKAGDAVTVRVPYNKTDLKGKIVTIKQMPRYADITTAYPDYSIDDAVYELKIVPDNSATAEALLFNATVSLDKP